VKQQLRIAGLIAATVLLTGCSLFGDEEEELLPKELVDIEESVKVKRIWSAKLGGDAEFLRVALRPIGDGSRIYAASQDGNVSAFDPQSGKLIWRTELDIELSAGPGFGEGHLAVAGKDGFVVLLDANDGSAKWRVDVSGETLARPLIKGQTVVVQTIDNRLEALSLYDGRSLWSLQQTTPVLTMRGSASPVAAGNTAIAGFDAGRLVAVELDTGEVVWDGMLSPPKGRSDLDRLADVDGEMALIGQDLYATSYQGRLVSLAAESGQVLWNREISSYEGVAADWNSLYTVTDSGEVIGLTRRNGAEIWRDDSLLRREPTLPMPFGTTVVVGDLEGYLHFFSTIDGEAVARVKFGNSAISADPYVIANTLYVQSDSGQIAAYVIVIDRPKRTQPDVADDGS
jgi:outer membrane protein assembly factor BamB